MRFLFLAVSLLSSSLMVGCVGDPAVIGPPPKDGSVPDQQAADGGLGDAGDGAISDPTWTLPLLKGISLGPIAVDPNGDVYVGGSIMDAFTLDAINIPTTQKNDGIVLKLDGRPKRQSGPRSSPDPESTGSRRCNSRAAPSTSWASRTARS